MNRTDALLALTIPLLAGLAFAAAAGADESSAAAGALVGWPRDPVYVYYPRASCRGDEIDLQVFDHRANDWVDHPAHPRIPVDSCQLEDASVLWSELRWRCVEPTTRGETAADWLRGLDVFDPEIMERCAVPRDGDGFGEMRISVASPPSDMPLRAADPVVDVEGSVRLGGLRGADYDVVLAIDVSEGPGSARRIGAQVAAARRFVDRVQPRMGATRLGVITYPNANPRSDERGAARAEVHLTDDSVAVRRALHAIERRGSSGAPDFASGLAFGLDELQRVTLDESGARPGARKLLLIGAEGSGPIPFGADTEQRAAPRAHVASLAHRAQESGVSIHLYALGGSATEPSTLVNEMLRDNRGGFVSVPRLGEAADYLRSIRMPYVASVAIRNDTTGQAAHGLEYEPGGRFRGAIPVAFGANQLRIEARSSDDERALLVYRFDFDGSLVKDRLLEGERERLERLRRRREVIIELPEE